MTWLSGWSWAKEISLTGQTGAGTLYQVELDIGASAGGDFHLEGHCTNFPQDIEVTDDDGTTLLDFWIEDITADPIKLWVEVADDLGSNQKVWVYYGKSGASTNSDITTTFLFGDDFPGTSIDTGKWSDNGHGTSVVSGGKLTYTGSIPTWGQLSSISTYARPLKLHQKTRLQGRTTDKGSAIGFRATGTTDIVDGIYFATINQIRNYDAGSGSSANSNFGTTEKIYETIWTSSTVTWKQDGVAMTGSPLNTNIPSVNLPVAFQARGGAGYGIECDWIFLAKYNSPEPAFSSAGSEQSAPSVGHPTMKRWGGIPGMRLTGRNSW